MPRALSGRGRVEVAAPRDHVWSALLDPALLQRLIPGADRVQRLGADRFEASLSFDVGRVRGRYDVELQLSEVVPPRALDLAGQARGWLGGGRATARVELTDASMARTTVTWRYAGVVTGPVALAGTALLGGTSRLFVQRFFVALSRHLAAEAGSSGPFAMANRERPVMQR